MSQPNSYPSQEVPTVYGSPNAPVESSLAQDSSSNGDFDSASLKNVDNEQSRIIKEDEYSACVALLGMATSPKSPLAVGQSVETTSVNAMLNMIIFWWLMLCFVGSGIRWWEKSLHCRILEGLLWILPKLQSTRYQWKFIASFRN